MTNNTSELDKLAEQVGTITDEQEDNRDADKVSDHSADDETHYKRDSSNYDGEW